MFFIVIFLSVTCSRTLFDKNQDEKTTIITNPQGLGYNLKLEFLKGKSHHYPLIAVWIEDLNGSFIQNVYVSKSVARGTFDHADNSLGKWKPGHLVRPATLPYWAHKEQTMSKRTETFPNYKNPIPDAYTGATPKSNFVLKSSTDKDLNQPFRVVMEINQFFDFNKFWFNNKFPDDLNYKTSGQPALVLASEIIYPQKLPITVNLTPIGHSHYSGENGSLFTSLNTLTTALQIVESVKVTVYRK